MYAQAAPTLPRTASCPTDLQGGPLSKLNEPTISLIHSPLPTINSASIEVTDSCNSSFNPVERCKLASNNLIACAARIRFTRSLLPMPLAHDTVVTRSMESMASPSKFQRSKAQRRLLDQVQTATGLNKHNKMAIHVQLQANTASKKIMTRLPQAVQAIITTNRFVSGKVFCNKALPVVSPVLSTITTHKRAEPSFIETKLSVEISSLASSCATVSADAQHALSNASTPSCLLARPGLRASTDVLPAPVKARLCSHFFVSGDFNPLGSIAHEVPLLVDHRTARFRTEVEVIAI